MGAARKKIDVDDVIGIEDKIDQTLAELTKKQEKKKDKKPSSKRTDIETRADITRWFVLGNLLAVPVTLVIMLSYNAIMIACGHADSALDVEKILPLVTTFIGSPMGFVLGYYFKSGEQKK